MDSPRDSTSNEPLGAQSKSPDSTDPWIAKSPTIPPRSDGESPAFEEVPVPDRIGRYRIEQVLGSGGFATVYLGYDEDLQRRVAVKVPHPERVADAEAYLTEARILASLDHANIVPVHDVGRTEDGLCCVVSKFIEGANLRGQIDQQRFSATEAAELVATVAEALHYAHTKGPVHRDIKPENILIDGQGKPYIADFGIALRDEDFGKGSDDELVGTPTYMSPEQARGEGHLVDGRSDIFSVGVVLYELLTGVNPFRGANWAGSVFKVTTVEVKPPRQIHDSIPKELERICLKSLSKRATDRYTTAKDFADDLRHFLDQLPRSAGQTPVPSSAGVITTSTIATLSSVNRTIKIVPKGLRSFDAQDADFFLELLPGPRDRDGLPDSIRFWKTRIEQTDPDETFRVGLIYGPSGCGKSSLVKAGLLPRLAEHVLAVYVEATADQTETRLLHGLRKRCPALPNNLDLKETLATLRRGQGLALGRKVVIVLDQFEQWLHVKGKEENPELVEALRQCDGGRVQCVVMVRDDFWMAVIRFLADLEAELLQNQNFTAVDLFDLRHAQRVLKAYGRAYGALPENTAETTTDQQSFVDEAVSGLAEDGKIICVRLALFAEMMKGKPWTPATLKAVGGTRGVGVTFLEETFSSRAANPRHRFHQNAARAVLKALLPESGSDIKGNMRPHQELLDASGYKSRPKDFDDLIDILDSEIRLITPTDPQGSEPADDSTFKVEVDQYYQLTHDYLVPSLREWLTRKQKESRRGRAEMRLAERAGVWNAKPENRHLPSLWEYLNIRLLTDNKKWTSPQRTMMAKAVQFHGFRAGLAGLVMVAVNVAGFAINARLQDRDARALVQTLLGVKTANVIDLVGDIDNYRQRAVPLLKNVVDGKESTRRQKLHASLALLTYDPSQADYLLEQLLSAQVEEVPVIITLLKPQKSRVQQRLWEAVKNGTSSARLRAAAALAAYDPDNPDWRNVRSDVATALVSVAPTESNSWFILLQPVGMQLVDPLDARYRDRSPRRDSDRPLAAAALADYLRDQPTKLAELILLADNDSEFQPFLGALTSHRSACVDEFQTLVKQPPPPDTKPEVRDRFWKKQANAAVCLLGLGEPEVVWPLLKQTPNPSLRNFIVDRLARMGADYKTLADRLAQEADSSIRQALILALGDFDAGKLSSQERQSLVEKLSALYREDPDPGVHSAAGWTMRRYQTAETVTRLDAQLQKRRTQNDDKHRRWLVNSQGQTFIVVDGPVEFLMGDEKAPKTVTIAYRFAMATNEVTIDQFRKCNSWYAPNLTYAPEPDCPANDVTWSAAAAYCNWLSEKDGIPKDQWCYEKDEKGAFGGVNDLLGRPGIKIRANCLRRTGYRLPTEAEWEYVCRANTRTSYSFGEPVELLERYGWHLESSRYRARPVGRLRPNALGVFDMHGNVNEWCQERLEKKVDSPSGESESVDTREFRVLRGGAFDDSLFHVRSASRYGNLPGLRNHSYGFRPARTYP